MESTFPAVPDPIVLRDGDREREETFWHYIAREGRTVMHWIMIISLVATVVMMVSPFWMAAVIPAVILLLAYAALAIANEVEARSDVEAHEVLERAETAGPNDIVLEDRAEADQLPAFDQRIIKRESKMGIAILGALLLAALILAWRFLPGEVVAIGAFVLFAYMLLVAAPLWLGWIEDDIEIQQTTARHEPS